MINVYLVFEWESGAMISARFQGFGDPDWAADYRGLVRQFGPPARYVVRVAVD